ncbi:hypothetical protein [Streptomyces sp. RTd22]|uniref:aromatic-ring hydroxylase C-terminal domain-containing protein n=1 Tax=Streptomyces sp. RTd22 TaxID=1841249 RepID=UPI002D21929A|nr:hypothetical protein [Streptomyces sp. RTd22]
MPGPGARRAARQLSRRAPSGRRRAAGEHPGANRPRCRAHHGHPRAARRAQRPPRRASGGQPAARRSDLGAGRGLRASARRRRRPAGGHPRPRPRPGGGGRAEPVSAAVGGAVRPAGPDRGGGRRIRRWRICHRHGHRRAGRRGADRVRAVSARPATAHPGWDDVRTVLVRPDGHVAWAYSEARVPSMAAS